MLWDQVPILTTMILNYNKLGKQNKGSKFVVCAREGGANTTSLLAAHFAKRNTKNCGGEKRSGESEGGQKFLPPNPLPFCPPERKSFNQNSKSGFSSKKVQILTKRHRQFSEFGFWAIVASPRQRRGSASARILKGFLKSKNNFCPLKRKFGLLKANINLKNLLTNLFSSAKGERQSDNLILTAQII
jgi:hypothetical protein